MQPSDRLVLCRLNYEWYNIVNLIKYHKLWDELYKQITEELVYSLGDDEVSIAGEYTIFSDCIEQTGRIEQNKIDKYRKCEAYEILTKYDSNVEQAERDKNNEIDNLCTNCHKHNHSYWISPCKHNLCIDCVEKLVDDYCNHLRPPYFHCPFNHCRRKVLNIHHIKIK